MFVRTLAALAVITTIAFTPAVAHSRHHHQKPSLARLITCDRFGCRETAREARRDVSRHSPRPTTTYSAKTNPTASLGESTALIRRARAYLGMNATQVGLKRHRQWCAAFLRHLGVALPDDRAISGLKLPRTTPHVGALAVFAHHIGVVTGFEGRYPVLLSGNSTGRRVYEGLYPRVPIAYVEPLS